MTDVKRLADIAEAALKDPVLMRQIGDRVYELLQEDMRAQRDRNGGHWRTPS